MRKFFIRYGNKYEGEHNIYESVEEFQRDFPHLVPFRWARDDYRILKDGMWVEAEDGFILECLAYKKLVNKTNRTTFIYRMPNYLATVYIKSNGTPKFSKYYGSISSLDSHSMSTYKRVGNPENKIKFAAFVAAGMSLRKAFYLSFTKSNSSPISISDNKLIRLMNDKLVVNQIKHHLTVFKDDVDNKFSDKRLLQEIDDLLTYSKKGSNEHRQNIQFIMELKGMLTKRAEKNIEDAEYNEAFPFQQDVKTDH